MKSNKYTLDRFEGDVAVFLLYPDEIERKLIPVSELNDSLKEGDIVSISMSNDKCSVTLLEKETADQKDKINHLLEKLKRGKV